MSKVSGEARPGVVLATRDKTQKCLDFVWKEVQ